MKGNLLLLKDLLESCFKKQDLYAYDSCVKKVLYLMFWIVNKYNSTFHRTIKMNPIDVKSHSYDEYDVSSNEKYPKFKIGDHFRISKYKNILVKDMLQIDQKNFLLLMKLMKQFHGHMSLVT